MTVMRGKRHVFLGMEITYNNDGTASIRMEDYIKEAIQDFGEAISKKATSPATRDLFEIDQDSEKLNTTQNETFHSIVAKLLYVSIRGRPDIELAVAFLCTRVSCSTKQDWSKLRRLLEYLNGSSLH